MESVEIQLEEMLSMSKLGRYEIVKLALEQIEVIRKNEGYRKFTQIELINKALSNVITNNELYKKK